MVSENIRIKFIKTGRLKFISHLDLCRTMKSALIRAKVPIWYSEGYNPRPKMVFALPLSIGSESVCEFLDIRLIEEMSYETIKKRLNDALTSELMVKDVYPVVEKFSEIGWAEYMIIFEKTPENCETKLSNPLIISKHSKSGDKDVNIAPLIKRFDLQNNVLTLLLSADSENYLNPDYVAKALTDDDYAVTRVNIFRKDSVTPFI